MVYYVLGRRGQSFRNGTPSTGQPPETESCARRLKRQLYAPRFRH